MRHGEIYFVNSNKSRILASDFRSEITRRYAPAAVRNVGNSKGCQGCITVRVYSVNCFHFFSPR